jgi:hypothetical protein
MASVIAQGGFVRTGTFLRSVSALAKHSGDAIGFEKIQPTGQWPAPGRPTLTWADRGTRKGLKLRKSLNIFSRTATGLRNIDQGFIADKIAEALNG